MGWGGRWEGGSGWGTRVRPWWIHVDVWQNQYNIFKILKIKKNFFLNVAAIGKCSVQQELGTVSI